MDAAELRAMQAPIKERYKGDPGAAMITLKAKGTLDDQHIACKVDTGRALAVAGLHPATGGSGLELCSGDMLLEALVACAGVTLKAVSTALDIPLKSGQVSAEGDLDFRADAHGCLLGLRRDAQGHPLLPRVAHHLSHLGFCHILGVQARHPVTFVMHAEHDVRRLGLGLVEELHQHQDHELHRGVVVVVENDLVAPDLLDLALLFGREIAFAVLSL